jgi:type I restriction enzyme R subunit
LNEHITTLLVPSPEDELAKRFDLLMYNIMLGELQGVFSPTQRKKLVQTGEALAQKGHLERVQMQSSVISRIQQPIYWEEADLIEHESVRTALRDLLDLVERQGKETFYTNFIDTVIESGVYPTTYPGHDYRSYRAKVAAYLREHQNDLVIHKLRNNAPLTESDYQYLEQVLWGQIGSVEDYRKEYGDEPLLKMVARMVGMDQQAALDLFNDFLSDHTLNSNQIHFVKLIVDHVVQNGSLDKSILNDPPFSQFGQLIELFSGKIDVVQKIVQRIDGMNQRLAVG